MGPVDVRAPCVMGRCERGPRAWPDPVPATPNMARRMTKRVFFVRKCAASSVCRGPWSCPWPWRWMPGTPTCHRLWSANIFHLQWVSGMWMRRCHGVGTALGCWWLRERGEGARGQPSARSMPRAARRGVEARPTSAPDSCSVRREGLDPCSIDVFPCAVSSNVLEVSLESGPGVTCIFRGSPERLQGCMPQCTRFASDLQRWLLHLEKYRREVRSWSDWRGGGGALGGCAACKTRDPGRELGMQRVNARASCIPECNPPPSLTMQESFSALNQILRTSSTASSGLRWVDSPHCARLPDAA